MGPDADPPLQPPELGAPSAAPEGAAGVREGVAVALFLTGTQSGNNNVLRAEGVYSVDDSKGSAPPTDSVGRGRTQDLTQAEEGTESGPQPEGNALLHQGLAQGSLWVHLANPASLLSYGPELRVVCAI